ncbi:MULTISPECIES: hypothetical protein [unclassified Streptomyces]|uniref:hypothetical protein n=1 Tax=unclassified Streptomyces TaxID=2593676 RepID=UPI00109E62DB|nr:hypothetical protein [Streptomyces sp. A1136]THA50177.1 hypothetical protein E6R62_26125 [Streptomyces sp. A1136]
MLDRVQDVVVEGPLGADRLRERLGLDGTRVPALGVGVQGAAGGGAEQSHEGGQWRVGDVADRVQT